MHDPYKTNTKLIEENALLRQRIAELEQSESERKPTEEALLESEGRFRSMAGEMAVIAEISRVIGSTLEIDEVYERFAAEAKKLIPVDSLAINLYNFQENTMRVAHVSGVNIDRRKQGDPLVLEGSLSEAVIRAQTGLRIQPANINEIVSQFPRLSTIFQAGLRSIMCVPLVSRDEVIGVLHFRSKTPNAYTEQDLRLAERIGAQIAGAIANAQLFSDLKQAEEALQRVHNELEQRVADRTEELMRVNEELRTEITERKKVEDAIIVAKNDWENTFDAVTDMVTIHDMDFNIIRANPAAKAMLGLQLHDGLPSPKCFRLYHGTEKPPSECASCQSLQTERPSIVEVFEPHLNKHLEIRAMPRFGSDSRIIGLIHVVRDITERKQTEEALQAGRLQLKAILDNIPDIAWLKDKESRLIAVNEPFGKSCGFEPEDLVGKTDLDIWPKDLAERYRADDKEVMESGKRKQVEEPLKDSEGKAFWIETIKTPIFDEQGNVLGTVGIARDITERKKAEEKLKDTLESLRKAVGTTIQVMVSAVDARDPYTAGHQIRVANLARAIAREIGLPQEKIEGIRMAGSIHDIGKLSIPAEILSKPTKLSNIEFSLIKEHSLKGYEILKDVESPWPLAQIVYQHHERMNGSGYPRNLKEDEILVEARIMAVADVVESMASYRPYRPALGINAALEEIEKNKGILYDADVADACLKLFLEKGFKLEGA